MRSWQTPEINKHLPAPPSNQSKSKTQKKKHGRSLELCNYRRRCPSYFSWEQCDFRCTDLSVIKSSVTHYKPETAGDSSNKGGSIVSKNGLNRLGEKNFKSVKRKDKIVHVKSPYQLLKQNIWERLSLVNIARSICKAENNLGQCKMQIEKMAFAEPPGKLLALRDLPCRHLNTARGTQKQSLKQVGKPRNKNFATKALRGLSGRSFFPCSGCILSLSHCKTDPHKH